MFPKLKDFFRGKKKIIPEEIPVDCIKCPRCGHIVEKRKAILQLPDRVWVCDECFFGQSE